MEQNPPNTPRQDTPIPHMPCEQTPQKPIPGPSDTQWLEDLFCSKQKAITFLILTFDSSELTLPPFVEPSKYNEPLIPGLSPSSKPHEPEPKVAPIHSSEKPFG
ncbi:hypothetical protein O181_004847 [Austropuccinia psidii MF-1]|uniref:Uncharacterized protein n=1 Tax=Austropuccinia psidii MF-1 TaxID=1389203 RepID=A0A9Q3GG67_9BASI|nr:hypothetical protein [Austropuccinia psidii MF-1]